MARNKSYKKFDYRLDDWVAKKIKEFRRGEKSYNLLFVEFIKLYDKHKT